MLKEHGKIKDGGWKKFDKLGGLNLAQKPSQVNL